MSYVGAAYGLNRRGGTRRVSRSKRADLITTTVPVAGGKWLSLSTRAFYTSSHLSQPTHVLSTLYIILPSSKRQKVKHDQ
jgi:hypothetical protein